MDDESSSNRGKVAKLLPKGLAAKGRWRKQPSKESFEPAGSSEDVPRGRSPHSRETLYSHGGSDHPWSSQSQAPSQSTGMVEEDEGGDDETVSPLIDDSDPDM